MSSSSPGSSNPRKKAAAARAEQLAKEKRRDTMVKIIGGVVVAVVVIGIVVLAVVSSKKDAPVAGPTANPSNTLPTGVDPSTYGFVINASVPATAPKVDIWEDYQCPACKLFEESGSGPAIVAAGKAGKYNVQLRPTTFLDTNLRNTASAAATSAWGCAINAGKGLEYHATVFANQPATEGTGYTTAQLLDFGKQAGITGAAFDTFTSCVNANTFLGWAANSTAEFNKQAFTKSGGTPAVFVNGKELANTNGVYGDPAKLLAAIDQAAAAK
ncbi:MAG: thioredoxin domain-containing protein [Actinomycetes bacterium]